MNVSVVLLTANRRLRLESCIQSLGRQSRQPDEVVVLDMGSHDGTSTFLDSIKFEVPVRAFRIDQQNGGSFAEARNAGISRANGDIIAFIDDDCEADPYWLERLLKRLETLSAVGGSVLPADAIPVPDEFSPSVAWAVGLTPPEFFGPRGGVDVLPQTANLAARKSLFERYPFQGIGGNLGKGASIYAFGREDAEWWRRLRRAGEPVGVERRAIVWHHVESDRFDHEAVLERARLDGLALWRREKPRHMVRPAAADIVGTPAHVLSRTIEPRYSDAQAWGEGEVWAARQASFLRAGVDDRGAGIATTERANAFARESLSMVGGIAKSNVRPFIAAAYQAVTTSRTTLDAAAPPARLLVVLHPFLGDSVLALPLLRQLRKGLSESELVLMAGEGNAPLLADQLEGWEVRALPPAAVGNTPSAVAALLSAVQAARCETILLTYLHGLSPIPFFLNPKNVTIGWTHDNGLKARLWGQMLKVPVEKRWDQHESVALLNFASTLGVTARAEHPVIKPGEKPRERVAEVLKRLGVRPKSYIAIHVERESDPKYWFEDGYSALAGLMEKTDFRVALVGSKAGRAAADQIRRVLPSAVSLHGALDTAELAAFLAEARAFIGADSGPQHVAAAVGCPSLVLFGPTDERRWGAIPTYADGRQDSRRILRVAPSDWTREELDVLGSGTAMKRIDHERVFSELLELLEATTPAG